MSLALVAPAAFASSEDVLALLREPGAIAKALEGNEPIRGSYKKQSFGRRGPLCRSGTRMAFEWEFSVENVRTDLDSQGNTTIEVVLGKTDIHALAHKRDPLLCLWAGGDGRIELGQIKLFLHLVPMSEDRFPGVSADGIQIAGLDMSRVAIGLPGILYPRFNTPRWFDRWTEAHLNVVFRRFFESDAKRRLDAYLTAELAKRVGTRHSDANLEPQPLLTP